MTAVEVTETESADSPYLAPFVETTARSFEVSEVSGDKAYVRDTLNKSGVGCGVAGSDEARPATATGAWKL